MEAGKVNGERPQKCFDVLAIQISPENPSRVVRCFSDRTHILAKCLSRVARKMVNHALLNRGGSRFRSRAGENHWTQ